MQLLETNIPVKHTTESYCVKTVQPTYLTGEPVQTGSSYWEPKQLMHYDPTGATFPLSSKWPRVSMSGNLVFCLSIGGIHHTLADEGSLDAAPWDVLTTNLSSAGKRRFSIYSAELCSANLSCREQMQVGSYTTKIPDFFSCFVCSRRRCTTHGHMRAPWMWLLETTNRKTKTVSDQSVFWEAQSVK